MHDLTTAAEPKPALDTSREPTHPRGTRDASDLERAMQFWFGRINFETRSAKPSELKLDRMRCLLDHLGRPHENLRIVHVAGSKGKGSTSAMLAAILQRAGYRTGLFTSPHLVGVEERYQVDGATITSQEFTANLNEIEAVSRRSRDPEGFPLCDSLTFFEIATALSFLHFARRRVEVAVLEVGLGGRFDSTNVCNPMLSLITSISYDHMQQLGNSLDKIAREKAGIIKPGKPTISGVTAEPARGVIEQICRERGSRLQQLQRDFRFHYEPARIGDGNVEQQALVEVVTRRDSWPRTPLGLLGEHQAANAAVAVAAVEELRAQGLTISDQAVADGLAQVVWPARLEIVGCHPVIVLDCAHNVASVHALLQTLRTSFRQPAHAKRWLIFASGRDKDVEGMLREVAGQFDHLYLTRFTSNPRSLMPEQLAELLPTPTPAHVLCADPLQALASVRQQAQPDDLICIAGSVFLAGELRPHLVASAPTPP